MKIKRKIQFVLLSLVIGTVLYGVFWVVTLPKIPQSEIVSRNGIHIHSTLSISINGESVNIPAGIGISKINHSSMHTHDPNGVIHMEYSGVVQEKDIKLERFFDIWGEDFNQDSFMGNPIEENSVIKMTVNGEENLELEEYSMKDGDIIEIIYK